MKSLVCALLFSLLGLSCRTGSPDGGTIALFDGKSLRGWSHVLADPAVPFQDVWKVEDGILKCSGKPVGALFKGPDVRDFRLVVEYRWPEGVKPSNSGIFSRIEQPVEPLPRAIETQLQHGNAGDVLGLKGKAINPAQPRSFAIKAHPVAGDIAGVRKLINAENPPGQWNRVEILAKGDTYKVWMNGKLVNEVSGVSVVKGKVGVQSEGDQIHFRKVDLTPLAH